jgi:predicted DNA-binding protein (MmcQ/YjbR family)
MTHNPLPPTAAVRRREAILREFALEFPGTHEDFPWGHRAIKIGKKAFVFLVADGDGLSLSLKLTTSHTNALDQTFAVPTGYGLGKSGWVTATFAPHEEPPLEMLRAWIDESFRAIAPKTVVKGLGGAATDAKVAKPARKAQRKPSARATPARKKAARKQPARKR